MHVKTNSTTYALVNTYSHTQTCIRVFSTTIRNFSVHTPKIWNLFYLLTVCDICMYRQCNACLFVNGRFVCEPNICFECFVNEIQMSATAQSVSNIPRERYIQLNWNSKCHYISKSKFHANRNAFDSFVVTAYFRSLLCEIETVQIARRIHNRLQ